MALLSTTYATDEDLFIRAGYDLTTLTPRHQVVAVGADGAIDGGDFVLTSAGSDFATSGVVPGMVLQLLDPRQNLPGGVADILAVEAAGVTTLTLRRVGFAPGEGRPPYADDTAGISFRVATLAPQVEECSYRINERCGLNRSGRAPAGLDDLRQLRSACVAMALRNLYTMAMRQAGQANDDFKAKADLYRDECSELMAALVLRWTDTAVAPTQVGFGRLSR